MSKTVRLRVNMSNGTVRAFLKRILIPERFPCGDWRLEGPQTLRAFA